MEEYLDLVDRVLASGVYKDNRTGVDTIASFSEQYTIDLADGFPLLTTKAMDGPVWNSLRHELIWYLSGEEHIRTLREHTGIWDAWADDDGRLDTAYGRFWRRFPLPDEQLPGESWVGSDHRWVNEEGTFDQLQYVLDGLKERPHSRRFVVTAWHPANAAESTLPPCHYTFVITVQDERLHLHLTQRSGDIALGVPFNIAAYSVLATAIARECDFDLGQFGHTIVDAHIYCGRDERGQWYAEHLTELQDRLESTEREEYTEIREWIEASAPEDDGRYDHVPNLLKQLTREPFDRPELELTADSLDELAAEDIKLKKYTSHDRLKFDVAE